jgi:hypothetical protein
MVVPMSSALRRASRTMTLGLAVGAAAIGVAPEAAAAGAVHQRMTVAHAVAAPIGSAGAQSNDSISCNADADFTGTRTKKRANAWQIQYTGGWTCSTAMAMSGQTALEHGVARTPVAQAPAFSVTAASAQSASSVSRVSGGHWSAEFVGSVQAPSGDVWTSVTAGCSGAGTATMTCDIVASGVLKES